MPALLIVLGAVGLIFLLPKAGSVSAAWVPIKGPNDYTLRILAAISSVNLDGIKPDLVYTVFDLETGGGRDARGLSTLNATRNPGNRHARRDWTGPVYYVSAADPNIEVYPSLEAGVQSFVDLMHDPLYAPALAAGRMGPAADFFAALKASGYSTQSDYAQALLNRYAQLVSLYGGVA